MTPGSATDQVAVRLADATGRSKEEIKLLGIAAAIAVAGAVALRTLQWLVDLGFDRSAR